MSPAFRLTLVIAVFAIASFAGQNAVAQPAGGKKPAPKIEREREREERQREEEREREEEEFEHARPRPPMPWGGGITVEPVEGRTDTISFHIGSPLFLRLKLGGSIACQPFNGQPFYFDVSGAQLGWGFEEINDSLLFPRKDGDCERIVMLTSENSNRIPEGVYTLKVMIFIDDKSRLYSDTLFVQPLRSVDGANELSYRRFLLEQLVQNSPLLRDPETVRALFAEGTPKSAESEVYRALVLYRSGDIAGAEESLKSAEELAAKRGKKLDTVATAISVQLSRTLHSELGSQ
jgi:hypothetical protein